MLLRRCPYCNLIWTKVDGCGGWTTCGNRPEGNDEKGWKGNLGYMVEWGKKLSQHIYDFEIKEGVFDRRTTEN
jgi:hypothetical protein